MASPDPAPSGAASDAPVADEMLWRAAVGEKSDYYLPRFAKYEREKKSFPSWHWPALFVPFFWALHRKAWGSAVLFFFLPPLISTFGFLASLGGKTANSIAHWISVLLIFLLPPMLANGLYFRRVRAWVQEARTRYTDSTAQLAFLTAKGGTSGAGIAVGAILAGVAIIGMLAAIALPGYHDYVIRSKVAEALTAVEPLKQQVKTSWNTSGSVPERLNLDAMHGVSGAAYIKDIRFNNHNGTITVTFGAIDKRLDDKSIEWVPTEGFLPIRWNCRVVDDIPAQFLPAICRH